MLSQALLLAGFLASPFALMGLILWRANVGHRASQR